MYAAPAIVPAAGTMRKSGFLTFAPVLIIGVILFLIGGTIVLALIPLYIQKKTVTVNTGVLTSKQSTMSVVVQNGDTGGRRKRAGTDLSSYVGGQVTAAGLETFRSELLSYGSLTKVSNLDIISINLAYSDKKRKRKRFALSKRASSFNIVLIITFKMIYIPGCLFSCQTTYGPTARNALYAIPVAVFNFQNVPISLNGAFITVPQIQFLSVSYVSTILPSLSSATPVVPVLTVSTTQSTTITTTTVSTTPSIG